MLCVCFVKTQQNEFMLISIPRRNKPSKNLHKDFHSESAERWNLTTAGGIKGEMQPEVRLREGRVEIPPDPCAYVVPPLMHVDLMEGQMDVFECFLTCLHTSQQFESERCLTATGSTQG